MRAKWLIQYQSELEQAKAARAIGNEGKARVCARRAAGVLAREYLMLHEIGTSQPSAYEYLRRLGSLPWLANDIKIIVGHFLMRINTDRNLPVEADLIGEAIILKTKLFKAEDE